MARLNWATGIAPSSLCLRQSAAFSARITEVTGLVSCRLGSSAAPAAGLPEKTGSFILRFRQLPRHVAAAFGKLEASKMTADVPRDAWERSMDPDQGSSAPGRRRVLGAVAGIALAPSTLPAASRRVGGNDLLRGLAADSGGTGLLVFEKAVTRSLLPVHLLFMATVLRGRDRARRRHSSPGAASSSSAFLRPPCLASTVRRMSSR